MQIPSWFETRQFLHISMVFTLRCLGGTTEFFVRLENGKLIRCVPRCNISPCASSNSEYGACEHSSPKEHELYHGCAFHGELSSCASSGSKYADTCSWSNKLSLLSHSLDRDLKTYTLRDRAVPPSIILPLVTKLLVNLGDEVGKFALRLFPHDVAFQGSNEAANWQHQNVRVGDAPMYRNK